MELWCSMVAVTMTLMLWTPFISFPWLDSLVSSDISHVALVLNNVPTLSFQTTRDSPSSGVWLQLYCSLLFSNIPRTFTNFLVLDCPILLQQWLPTLTSMNTSSGPPLVDVHPFFSNSLVLLLSVFPVVVAEISVLSLDVSDLYIHIVIPLTLVRLNYLFVYKLSVVEVVKLEDQQPPSVLLVVPSMSRSS